MWRRRQSSGLKKLTVSFFCSSFVSPLHNIVAYDHILNHLTTTNTSLPSTTNMPPRKKQKVEDPTPPTPPYSKAAPPKPPAGVDVHKIIVGVDFGTTYTGKSM